MLPNNVLNNDGFLDLGEQPQVLTLDFSDHPNCPAELTIIINSELMQYRPIMLRAINGAYMLGTQRNWTLSGTLTESIPTFLIVGWADNLTEGDLSSHMARAQWLNDENNQPCTNTLHVAINAKDDFRESVIFHEVTHAADAMFWISKEESTKVIDDNSPYKNSELTEQHPFHCGNYDFKSWLQWYGNYCYDRDEQFVVDNFIENFFDQPRNQTQACMISHSIMQSYASDLTQCAAQDEFGRLHRMKKSEVQRLVSKAIFAYVHPKDIRRVRESIARNSNLKV